jgi:hypothetical protein
VNGHVEQRRRLRLLERLPRKTQDAPTL